MGQNNPRSLLGADIAHQINKVGEGFPHSHQEQKEVTLDALGLVGANLTFVAHQHRLGERITIDHLVILAYQAIRNHHQRERLGVQDNPLPDLPELTRNL